MMKRNFSHIKNLGIAVGALALCSAGAQAQTTSSSSSTMSMSTMTAPVPVTGTVLRYYTDRAGYVTAMDVQTTDGVKWVRFSPGMAQRVSNMYPVGSTASVFVTPGSWGYDLAGLGTVMPAPGSMWAPYTVTDLDFLKATPYTSVGAKPTRVSGKLTGYVADDDGAVLAIVLDKTTLVRIPYESRQDDTRNVPDGVTPLFRNADVVAIGYPESPRYGVLTPFETRLIATSIVVDGRSLGAKGFGKLAPKGDTIFNANFGGMMGKSPDEIKAGEMGYTTYMAPPAPATP